MFSFSHWVKPCEEHGGALPSKAELSTSQGMLTPSALHLLLLVSREGEVWTVLAKLVRLILARDQAPLVAGLWLLLLGVPVRHRQSCKSLVVVSPPVWLCFLWGNMWPKREFVAVTGI